MNTIKPYNELSAGKKEQVSIMFDSIAPKYDFLNHFLSLGIDNIWRKKAIKLLGKKKIEQLLDVATGTGDFAIAAMKLKPRHITGIDLSEKMLAIGREKIALHNLQEKITLMQGDSENLLFNEFSFDTVSAAFGVRNFENLDKGLKEMYRVLKHQGTVVILEFSRPKFFPVKQLFNFYFYKILPFIGRLISKDKKAYKYLPESVYSFPDGENFTKHLEEAGFVNCKYKSLSLGVATIYMGEKL